MTVRLRRQVAAGDPAMSSAVTARRRSKRRAAAPGSPDRSAAFPTARPVLHLLEREDELRLELVLHLDQLRVAPASSAMRSISAKNTVSSESRSRPGLTAAKA